VKLIGRRNFVRGLGLTTGAGLLAPMARHIIAEAQGAPLTNAIFILNQDKMGFGTETLERWVPHDSDLTKAGALPDSFAPLAPWASEMLIMDRFKNPFNVGQHGNGFATLSATSSTKVMDHQQSEQAYPNPGGVTLDVLAGEYLSQGLPFRTVGLGSQVPGTSSDANRNPVPDFTNALHAYNAIFGSFDVELTAEESLARLEQRLSVLDRVGDDLSRMRSRLAGEERAKLDQFEGSVRELEHQIEALASAACAPPPAPAPAVWVEEGGKLVLQDPAEEASGHHKGPANPLYVPTMMRIAHAALTCHLTRVVVLRLQPLRHNWNFLGNSRDKHDTSHEGSLDAAANARLVDIDQYFAGHLADLLSALEMVPDAGGTMRDRALLTWMDEGGGRHHNGWDRHPVITVGNAQNWNTGRLAQFDPNQHNINDAFASILEALGVPTTSFGDASACKGPLPGLV